MSLLIGSQVEADTTSPADSASPADTASDDQLFRAAAGYEAETESIDWGEYRITGDFDRLTPVPESRAMLAFDYGIQQLVHIELITDEVTVGPAMSPDVDDIIVSADGTWVHLVTIDANGDGATIQRYSVPDLIFDTEFTIDDLVLVERPMADTSPPVVSAVADDGDRLVVATQDALGVYENGELLPVIHRYTDLDGATIIFPHVFASLVTLPGGYGYGNAHGAPWFLWEFTLDHTGITSRTVAAPQTSSFASNPDLDAAPVAVGGDLLWRAELFSVPDLEVRISADPFTQFDYDSTAEVILQRDGFGSVATVLDPESLDEIISGSCSADGVLAGDGRVVRRDGASIVVTNLFFVCGNSGEFHPLSPERIVDTRDGSGGNLLLGRLQAGVTTRVQVNGLGGVPLDGVDSVVLNVTAVNQQAAPHGSSYVSVWPAGFAVPEVSNINTTNNATVGNAVTVTTGAGGAIDVRNNAGTVHLTVDVMGYFSSALGPDGSRFEPGGTGDRLLDTRSTDGRLGPGETVDINVGSVANQATAVVLNVTAIGPSDRGFVQAYPLGDPIPETSSLNFEPLQNRAQLVTVEVGNDGFVRFRNGVGTVDLAVDYVGRYYVDEFSYSQDGRFIGINPFRDLDTRTDSPFDGDGRLTPGSSIILPGFRSSVSIVTNLTSVRTDDVGYLSAGPWYEYSNALDMTSSLNYVNGSVTANQAIIRASEAGEIGIFSSGRAHVLMDIFGFYTTQFF